MAKRISRRGFIKGLGLGASAGLLANAGLPLALARDSRSLPQQLQAGRNAIGLSQMADPAVELLVGDVVGFELATNQWEGDFGWVTFQLHQAFYNGDLAYYIRTDASDAEYATANRLVHVPLLTAAPNAEGATSQLYTFENGTADQFPVMSHVPETDGYSPAWQVHRVTFNGDATLLDSADAVTEAEANGDVTVEVTNLVVNHPVVKWPGGELAVDTELTRYTGEGPLSRPIDLDHMLVTFKLHECYPGSRYIITDTSAVPMAPMMSIAPSGATQGLADVGATDEIWVFGNGIPGSGVMGFQPAVFDNAAGNPIWSPFWLHFTAVWEDKSSAELITNSARLRELADSGALTIFNGVPDMDQSMPPFIVNCPVPIKAANTFSVDM